MSESRCFKLKESVMVASRNPRDSVRKEAIITGRTLEQNARYDVRFRDGTIELNIAAERIWPANGGSETIQEARPNADELTAAEGG